MDFGRAVSRSLADFVHALSLSDFASTLSRVSVVFSQGYRLCSLSDFANALYKSVLLFLKRILDFLFTRHE